MPDLDPLSFFPNAQQRYVERLLRRATEHNLRQQARDLKRALSGDASGIQARLSRQLGQALALRPKTRPSLRLKSPMSGGRPFHFSHSVVTRSKSSQSAGGGGTAGGGNDGRARAQAHVRYIERADAIERVPGPAIQASDGTGWERDPAHSGPGATPDDMAKKAQAYIENKQKVPVIPGFACSFGTIGDTIDERMEFWDLVESHERGPRARIQNRLIVELPHEVSPQVRLRIMKKFCKWFEDRELPYWTALHAPGPENDSRNYHAHIIFSERPSKKMIDATDGLVKWDFSITEKYRTSSGNLKIKHPHRRPRHTDLRDRHAIRDLRHHFANITNSVLHEANCRAQDGTPLRYDPRSYQAMGLHVAPMRPISRITADKNKKRDVVVDVDWTRAEINRKFVGLEAQREKRLVALQEFGRKLKNMANSPEKLADINPTLPKNLQIDPLKKFHVETIIPLIQPMLELISEQIHDRFFEKVNAAVLNKIIAVVDPNSSHATTLDTKAAAVGEKSDDTMAFASLHAAALEERIMLEQHKRRRTRTARKKIIDVIRQWNRGSNSFYLPFTSFDIEPESEAEVILYEEAADILGVNDASVNFALDLDEDRVEPVLEQDNKRQGTPFTQVQKTLVEADHKSKDGFTSPDVGQTIPVIKKPKKQKRIKITSRPTGRKPPDRGR